ncbi:unnamed protein product [Haemonchus placei]|uniref:Lactamase_B domain-containing protein n=1 Tax=Haemonchus placei TaxID=6290 RepID=A0A0N4X6S4_HAEPC|nr:unnamed protein product [Haemonchus placei]
MRITNNVELWNTPGHTAQDVSVMVSKVPCCGIVAVVGDLFYDEADALNISSEWFKEAWNPVVGKTSRDKVICHADYIIPGHGKLFKVDQRMKEMANCFQALNSPVELPPTTQSYTFPPFTFTTPQSSTASQQMATVSVPVTTPYSIPKLYDSDILAPVVEKAAFQLAKLLRVDQDAVSKKDPYPFTDFWQNTMQRIAKDINVNHIVSQAHTASMNKLGPVLNRLRSARDSLLSYYQY